MSIAVVCARLFPWFVYAGLFFLPWQTRYIFDHELINGQPWEYGTLSLYAVETLVIVAFLVGQRLHMHVSHRRVIRWTGMVVLAVAALIPFSLNLDLSFNAWSHLMLASLLFLVLLDQRVDQRRASWAFVGGLIIPSLLGLFQFFNGFSPASTLFGLAVHHAADLGVAVMQTADGRFLRAYGSFSHPNVFGGYLAVGLMMIIFLKRQMVRPMPFFRYLLSFISYLLSFAFILTFSRSAWLGFLLGFIGFVAYELRQHVSVRQIFFTVSPLLIPLMLASALFSPLILSRFQPETRLEAQSINDRVGQYQDYPSVVQPHLLLGAGMGGYTLALAQMYPGQPVWAYQPIHNTILLILGEIGIVGMLVLGGWIWMLFSEGFHPMLLVPVPLLLFDHYLWSSWVGISLAAFIAAASMRSYHKS